MRPTLEEKIKEIIQEYADNQDEMDMREVVAAVIAVVAEFVKVEAR